MTVGAQKKEALGIQIHVLTHRLAINPVMDVETLTELSLVLPSDEAFAQILSTNLAHLPKSDNAVAEIPPFFSRTKEILKSRCPGGIWVYFSAAACHNPPSVNE